MAMNESTWLTVKVSKDPTSRGTIGTRAALMQIGWLSCLLPMYFYSGAMTASIHGKTGFRDE